MTTVPAHKGIDHRSSTGELVFPSRLRGLLRDPAVSHQLLALLYSLDQQIADKGGGAQRPAFIQSRDVAFYANLDRKTIFTNVDRDGLTLIERAEAHGVSYVPGSSQRLIEKKGGPVGEAGSYWWPVQVSPTALGDDVVLEQDKEGVGTPDEDEPPRTCGGNLHSIEAGLRALTHPGAPLWTSKRAGLAAWRVTCLLVLAHGAGPATVTVREVASLVGMSISNTGRVLHRLAAEHLVSQSTEGWVFNAAFLLDLRGRMMEGRRDTLLGLDWRDRRSGDSDKGDATENRVRSREYVDSRLEGAERGAAKWFLDHRDALLDTVARLTQTCPEQAPSPEWVAIVRGLTSRNVQDYLAGRCPEPPAPVKSKQELEARREELLAFREKIMSRTLARSA